MFSICLVYVYLLVERLGLVFQIQYSTQAVTLTHLSIAVSSVFGFSVSIVYFLRLVVSSPGDVTRLSHEVS